MKKIVTAVIAIFLISIQPTNAQTDLRDLLGSLAGAGSSSSDGNGSALGNAIGGLISGLLGDKQLTEADLAGVYNYKEPAVTFKSDNLLQKAGGAAMAATIVNKLSPYYERVGMQNLVVTLTPEKSFDFSLGKIKLSGTFERDSAQTAANIFIFNFKALGKIGIGKISADVQRTANGLTITFDASKMLSLANSIAKLSGKQTLQTVAGFLNSYDGLNCGFSLIKTGNAAPENGSQTQPASPTNNNQPTTDTSKSNSGLESLLDRLKQTSNR